MIILHSYRRCPFAIRVRMTLEEKKLSYDVKEEDLAAPSKELLALHPDGRVPVLIHDEFVIYESAIITQYLEEGRSFVLVDTRNDYEIQVGTFAGSIQLQLATFRQFAEKGKSLVKSLQDKTVVTFCTGGIRCEKASALLMKLGLKDVFQLDGGILSYFEENGAAHFQGNCFVFDWRLAVNGNLLPAPRSEDTNADFGRHRHNTTKRP